MTANAAIMAARAAGVGIEVDGNDLVLEASAPPPAAVIELLSRYKASILTQLRPATDCWTVEDWHALFNERASIAEFDGGLTRAEAESQALEACIVEWLNRNPHQSDPDHCSWCGKPNEDGHAVVPFGGECHGYAWLHPECWASWSAQRRRLAGEELARMGIRGQQTQSTE